jgi:hypothetical protein
MRQKNDNCNWAGLVRHLLCNLGFAEVWLNQGVPHLNSFMQLCKQRLFDQFIQEWHTSLNSSPEAYLYNHLKKEFSMSKYMFNINVSKYQIAYCKFVCKNHRLAVMTG